ncbi:MAG: type II toxin-antitoxin system RelE/ParE family toxin [Verrucomicrobiae bacterium]|nr:type II toxin-antitoxin system RelE/ParE family toxin [Verrucomicrobiae bacterium]
MSVRKSGDFISDVENQFEWYAVNANWEIAERYLDAVEATCLLLGQHPQLGPCAGFSHPRLHKWRFIIASVRFRSTFFFTKLKAMMYCCAGPCTVIEICRTD